MIFKNVTDIQIPQGAVVKIATALDGVILWQKKIEIPNTEIWYTSTDGNIIEPKTITGNTLISNTYENGVGKLVYEGEVTKLPDYMFGYKSTLSSVTLPNSLTTIGIAAFVSCNGLTHIEIPDSVTTIDTNAFRYCKITSIKLSNSLTTIKMGTFDYCDKLTFIEIPDSVTSIGYNAFTYCLTLKSIKLSNSLTTIGESAFEHCGIDSIEIPNSVTTISNYAFEHCFNLISVEIPNSVTSLGKGAFYFCEKLNNVTIPDSINIINVDSFYNTRKLNSLIFESLTAPSISVIEGQNNAFANAGADIPEGEKFIYIHQNADYESYTTGEYKTQLIDTGWQIRFIEEEEPEQPNNEIWYTTTDEKRIIAPTIAGNTLKSNTYENGVGKLVYENELTTIENNMFTEYNKLKTITIPDSVTVIDYHAFYKCSSLENITIPDSVTSLGFGVFVSCTSLKDITIPDSVTSLDGVCANCTSLETITLSKNISKIEDYSFRDTYKLKTIIAPALVAPSCMNTAFLNVGTEVEGDKILYIYKEATGYEAWLELLPGFSIQYITE